MCKHVTNAQVSIRAPCCKKWFDCSKCHNESADHSLKKQWTMTLACKKCRKCFRLDMQDFDPETDEYCPSCDNHFVIEAQGSSVDNNDGAVMVALEGTVDMIKDDRSKQRQRNNLHTDHRESPSYVSVGERGTSVEKEKNAMQNIASSSSGFSYTFNL
mmetsp:Transcript_18554/g.27651  ORF Transcript_18554/g.27651 Transcript_18554/m.27651 type:complete len:158 (-) Transcript_18554:87-560(-)